MAQLRRDYDKFTRLDTEIIVVGPEDGPAFEDYWSDNQLPFIGLPDPGHTVLKLYGQEINLFKFGRMPAMVVVDQEGMARFVHYGHSMADIPENKTVLAAIRRMKREPSSPRPHREAAAGLAG